MQYEADKKLKKIYDEFSGLQKAAHKTYLKSIHALVKLAEARDPYTKKHSLKVSSYAVSFAKYLGLPESYIDTIKLAAILHDIGKLGIKEEILLKNSSLSKKEYEKVKEHAVMGAEIIKPFKFFRKVITIIKHHHENYDGTGYPDGLKGEKIPLGSRILAIADVYDALTSRRAYRKAYPHQVAINIMIKDSGEKFDPTLLRSFVKFITDKEKKKGTS